MVVEFKSFVVSIHYTEAVAGDDKARIEKWLSENLLRKPTETDDQLWSKTPAVEFKFGIVQPFVLIQALPSTTH